MGQAASRLAKQGHKSLFALDSAGRALIVVDRDEKTRVVIVVAAKHGDDRATK